MFFISGYCADHHFTLNGDYGRKNPVCSGDKYRIGIVHLVILVYGSFLFFTQTFPGDCVGFKLFRSWGSQLSGILTSGQGIETFWYFFSLFLLLLLTPL